MMKKKIIISVLAGILLLSFVLALTETISIINFDGSSSPENLTFSGDESITRYLEIPRYASVDSALFNLTGFQSASYLSSPYLEIGNPDGTYEWSLRGAEFQNTNAILDELNDGSTSENLTFGGNENQTVYLKIPKHAEITNAYLNLSGHPVTCYQETADESTTCGGLATGSYATSNDGSWAYLNVNYSKPVGATNDSIWRIKIGGWQGGGNGIQDLSLPSSCWNYDANKVILRLQMRSCSEAPTQKTYAQCYNGGWNQVYEGSDPGSGSCSWVSGNDPSKMYDGNWGTYAGWNPSGWTNGISNVNWDGGAVFEEAMIWKGLYTYPQDPWLEVSTPDESYEWNYTGEFSTTEQTSSFSSEINSYLSSCSPNSENYCDVPLTIHSDIAGKIEISNIIINYSNISGTFDLSQKINQVLNSGACDCSSCVLDGDNCDVPFLFHSSTAGILEVSNMEIKYNETISITSYETIPVSPIYYYPVYFTSNITGNLNQTFSCNFTILYPNGTVKLSEIKNSSNNICQSSSVFLDADGLWNWSINATQGKLSEYREDSFLPLKGETVITNPSNWQVSMLTSETVFNTWIVKNIGEGDLTNCLPLIAGDLGNYTEYSNSAFNLSEDEEEDVVVTISQPAPGEYSTNFSITCNLTESLTETTPNNPNLIFNVIVGESGGGSNGGTSPGGGASDEPISECNLKVIRPTKKIVLKGAEGERSNKIEFTIENTGTSKESFTFQLSKELKNDCKLKTNKAEINGKSTFTNWIECDFSEEYYYGLIEITSDVKDCDSSLIVEVSTSSFGRLISWFNALIRGEDVVIFGMMMPAIVLFFGLILMAITVTGLFLVGKKFIQW